MQEILADPLTLDTVKAAFENIDARLKAIEASPAAPEKHARVLKHIYDWAQHFGMPALPSQVEKPKPVAPPPPVQPEGFQL
jgi:hypothetical protein